MTPETRIARHHLGDTLERVQRGGPHADDWTVKAAGPSGMVICTAATVDEAAADCAAQLRAGGWVPTHARLEWHSRKWQHHLRLHLDNYTADVMFAAEFQGGMWSVFNRTLTTDDDRILSRATREQAAATIAEWHAATLPSLHLPPFPTDGK